VSKLSERRKQVREFNLGEAEQELERLRRQLFDLRIQQQRGEVKNNRQFTQVRTDIGRLNYQIHVLNQAALEEELAEQEEREAAEGEEREVARAEEAETEEAAETEETQTSEAEESPPSRAAQAEEPTDIAKRGRKSKAKEEA
jgi:ribosomal protein L29